MHFTLHRSNLYSRSESCYTAEACSGLRVNSAPIAPPFSAMAACFIDKDFGSKMNHSRNIIFGNDSQVSYYLSCVKFDILGQQNDGTS
jgi:hypothetical protein